MSDEIKPILEYVKFTKLKGNVEIISDDQFIWDLGNLYLHFLLDNRDTLNLIQAINSKNKRVHIVSFFGSIFYVEDKIKKKKRSWLFVRHYYSEL